MFRKRNRSCTQGVNKMDANVTFDAHTLDTRVWLRDAINFAKRRDGTTKEVQMLKLLPIFGWAHSSYISSTLLPPVRRLTDESRQMNHAEVAACAEALGVPNPYDDLPQELPPDFTWYPFVGRINDGQNGQPKSPEKIERGPVLAMRHPTHPNARTMAWIVDDDSMDKIYVMGSAVYGVDFNDTSAVLKDGDNIVIEIVQHSLLGDSALIAMRRVKLIDGIIELQPISHNPGRRSIATNDSDLRAGTEIKVLTLIYKGEVG
jgi:hypothetical protein